MNANSEGKWQTLCARRPNVFAAISTLFGPVCWFLLVAGSDFFTALFGDGVGTTLIVFLGIGTTILWLWMITFRTPKGSTGKLTPARKFKFPYIKVILGTIFLLSWVIPLLRSFGIGPRGLPFFFGSDARLGSLLIIAGVCILGFGWLFLSVRKSILIRVEAGEQSRSQIGPRILDERPIILKMMGRK